MSRNLRHKQAPPVVATKTLKRSVASDNSSDDDYAGVDLISDTEEDEPDVEVAEELAIIESEEDDNDAVLQPDDDNEDQSSWAGFDLDSQPAFASDDPFVDNQRAHDLPSNIYAEAAPWDAVRGRRVRFDLSDSESSETEENVFPDIFLDQNSLDPRFRQVIENDCNNDNDDPPSDEGSYWDFRNEDGDGPHLFHRPESEDDESDSSHGSSGYETDEGETTEEDLPAAAKYVPARSVLRRPSADSSASEEDIAVTRRPTHRQPARNGPRLGSWVTDATKPFAVLDSRGETLIMFRARINRRYSCSGASSQEAQNYIEGRGNKVPQDMSPMLSNSANMMMSAMYTPLDTVFGSAPLGPPEAFYPFVSISANGAITQDSTSSFDDDDMDDDDIWNIGDLIDFGEETSDEEGVVEEEESSTSAAEPSTPLRPTTASSEDQAHPLLNHFDRGVVGAFRRNQSRHQLLTRSAASPQSLAFSGPYRQGTLRGIKGGRLAAANTPITPLRRSKTAKAGLTLSHTLMDSNAAEKKRKFSEEHHGHKRSRSLF